MVTHHHGNNKNRALEEVAAILLTKSMTLKPTQEPKPGHIVESITAMMRYHLWCVWLHETLHVRTFKVEHANRLWAGVGRCLHRHHWWCLSAGIEQVKTHNTGLLRFMMDDKKACFKFDSIIKVYSLLESFTLLSGSRLFIPLNIVQWENEPDQWIWVFLILRILDLYDLNYQWSGFYLCKFSHMKHFLMLFFCLILRFPPFHFLPLHHFCLSCSSSPCCHCYFSFLLVLLCFCFSFLLMIGVVWSSPNTWIKIWLLMTKRLSANPENCSFHVSAVFCPGSQLRSKLICWSLILKVFEVSSRNICWCLSVFTETESLKAEITNCTRISPSIVSWTRRADNCRRTLNLITHLLHLAADCFCSSVIILLFTCKSCAAVRPLGTDK